LAEVGELSVRMEPAGGGVAGQVQVLGAVRPEGRRSLVLLIHGYANSQPTASGSFDNCISNLETAASQSNSNLISPLFKFYWPGDTKLPVISQLSYPWESGPAVDSAGKLSTFLQGLAGPGGTPVEVHFVSHSLGGRVVLETLKHFVAAGANSPVLSRSMSLMAGAVPVHMAGDPNQLLRPALIPGKRQVLFSSSDLVLMIAFRLGETAAREGFFPEAVGTYGHPNGMWQQQNLKGYEHWDYWPSALAARYLGNFLDLPVSTPPPPNMIVQRAEPEERSLPTAAIPGRTLPARTLP
jgi:Alpha/beta hydrolase family